MFPTKSVLSIVTVVAASLLIGGCSSGQRAASKPAEAPVKMLSDAQYPDLPDLGYRSGEYNKIKYDKVTINPRGDFHADIMLTDSSNPNHSITLENLNLREMIPGVPAWARNDAHLTEIALLNTEWNRHQWQFNKGHAAINAKFSDYETKNFSRIDVSNNCLMAGKWEIIAFAREGTADEVPYYHGWFDFPREMYVALFEAKNGLKWKDHAPYLTDWKQPATKVVNLDALRAAPSAPKALKFTSLNDQLYPMKSERLKKARNIITPTECKNIDAFLDNSTTFATFSAPGLYERSNPRKTELGRFKTLNKIEVRDTKDMTAAAGASKEFELTFTGKDGQTTRLLVGGIKMANIPTLAKEDAHKGWQMPFGISCHSFYEMYDKSVANPDAQNPYYGMLLDPKGNWLDSHNIGTDGFLLFLDKDNPKQMHFYLLSFERHAFVGHFLVDL